MSSTKELKKPEEPKYHTLKKPDSSIFTVLCWPLFCAPAILIFMALAVIGMLADSMILLVAPAVLWGIGAILWLISDRSKNKEYEKKKSENLKMHLEYEKAMKQYETDSAAAAEQLSKKALSSAERFNGMLTQIAATFQTEIEEADNGPSIKFIDLDLSCQIGNFGIDCIISGPLTAEKSFLLHFPIINSII